MPLLRCPRGSKFPLRRRAAACAGDARRRRAARALLFTPLQFSATNQNIQFPGAVFETPSLASLSV
jgi:hypothetical protein